MRNDFCVVILTYKRADKIPTYKTLRRNNYTGPIYLVIDDMDPQIDDYIEKYGDSVWVFSKKEYAQKTDIGDNRKELNIVVLARNAVFDLVRKAGYEYFLVLDDDYSAFMYRFNPDRTYHHKICRKLDDVFSAFLSYYETLPALTLAMAQGGDFIGGKNGQYAQSIKLTRKAMNSFFCSVNRPFKFFGRINEDVNMYALLGLQGKLILSHMGFSLNQGITQHNEGGLTEAYLDTGTYVKSFYSVMYCPSAVKVRMMGFKEMRIHHAVSWNNAVPKILHEKNRIALSR